MSAHAFDTLAFANRLQAVGVDRALSEALADALGAQFAHLATRDDLRTFATGLDLDKLATKDDLRNFATKDDLRNFATKDDLRNFATKDDLRNFATKDDLRDLEHRLTIRLGTMLIVAIGALAALVRIGV